MFETKKTGGGMKEIVDGYYINADGTRGDPVGDD